MAAPRCVVCGRFFRPDVRSRDRQRHCGPRCAKKAKRKYDLQYKRDYRAKPCGQVQRQRESRKRRDQLGWTEYMRFWRKSNPARTAKLNRRAARRYYEHHRAEILAKRRLERARKSATPDMRSQ